MKGYVLKTVSSIKFKMAELRSLLTFNMFNIGKKTVPDSWTITIKPNVWFQGGVCPEKYQLSLIKK